MKIKIFFYFSLILLISIFYFLLKKENKLNFQNKFSEHSCNELNYSQSKMIHPSNFKSVKIDLHIDEKRKWIKLNLKDALNSQKINSYTNRKRVKAKMIFYLDKNFKCSHNVLIRAHGDQVDHRQGKGLPSLNVKILNGHIFGIVDFILLKPEVRKYDNEVYATVLLEELDLLAPRTASIILNYGSNSQSFIFQEKIVKEFVENNNLREGALYEGDERFVFQEGNNQNIRFVNHRLANSYWAKKNINNRKIAEIGLSILNYHGQFHEMKIPKNWVIDYYSLSKKTGYEHYFKKLAVFDAFMFALDAMGNISVQDRRFYYDSIEKEFLPIFYDGKPTLFSRNNLLSEPELYDIKELQVVDKGSYKFFYPNLLFGKVLNSAVQGSNEALNLLKKINISHLHNKLNSRGVKIDYKKTKQSIDILNKKLNMMKEFDNNRIFNLEIAKENIIEAPKSYQSTIKRKIMYYDDYESNTFLACDIYGNNCESKILSEKEYLNAISQELVDENNNKIIFLGKIKTQNIFHKWFFLNSTNINDKSISLVDNVEIFKTGRINVTIDKKEKKIFISKLSSDSKVFFKNGNLVNWEIFFEDNSTTIPKVTSDENGLTGCLTFIDLEVKNLKLHSENSKCEDSVNFIRVKGTVDSIDIKNSFSDSLDADFSDLYIKKIIIKNSGNDCSDVSYGNYIIEEILLSNCKDKGLSIGEKSTVFIKELKANNVVIGVAVKDFAELEAKSMKISNAEECVSAYNKKPEFSGGYAKITQINCKNYLKLVNQDKKSRIEILNYN